MARRGRARGRGTTPGSGGAAGHRIRVVSDRRTSKITLVGRQKHASAAKRDLWQSKPDRGAGVGEVQTNKFFALLSAPTPA